ncbi:MAG: ATP-binding protein [Candidatus Uhrbacteria bacterium]
MAKGKGGTAVRAVATSDLPQTSASVAVRDVALTSNISEEVILHALRDIGPPLARLRELVDNGCDHARRDRDPTPILVEIAGEGRTRTVRVADQGSGADRPGLNALVSFGESVQLADGHRKKGRFGFGGRAMLELLDPDGRMTYTTVPMGESDKCYVLSFSLREWLDFLFRRQQPMVRVMPRTESQFPSDWESGMIVEVTGFREDFPELAPNRVVRSLARRGLLPSRAERVLVNDKPLVPRPVQGERYASTLNIPGLGEVEVDLFIPTQRELGEHWTVGAMGEVCTFAEFYRLLPPEVAARIPSVFHHPHLCGTIDVPAFNAVVAMGRRQFDATELLGSQRELLERLIDVLAIDVGPELTERIAFVEKEARAGAHEDVLRDLVGDFHRAFGAPETERPLTPPARRKPVQRILFTTPSVELVVGEQYRFRVRTNPESDGSDVRWDDRNSGGKLNVRSGLEVVYTAGKRSGDFTLRAWVEGHESEAIVARIAIVERRELCLSPSRMTCLVGGEAREVRVRNIGGTTGRFQWDARKAGGKISANTGLRVVYTPGSAVGEFVLRAFDAALHQIDATCAVSVIAEDDDHNEHAVPRRIRINDWTAEVRFEEVDDSELLVRVIRGRQVHIVYVNITSAGFSDASEHGGRAVRQLILGEVFGAYCAMVFPDRPEEHATIRGQLYARFCGREAPKKTAKS